MKRICEILSVVSITLMCALTYASDVTQTVDPETQRKDVILKTIFGTPQDIKEVHASISMISMRLRRIYIYEKATPWTTELAFSKTANLVNFNLDAIAGFDRTFDVLYGQAAKPGVSDLISPELIEAAVQVQNAAVAHARSWVQYSSISKSLPSNDSVAADLVFSFLLSVAAKDQSYMQQANARVGGLNESIQASLVELAQAHSKAYEAVRQFHARIVTNNARHKTQFIGPMFDRGTVSDVQAAYYILALNLDLESNWTGKPKPADDVVQWYTYSMNEVIGVHAAMCIDGQYSDMYHKKAGRIIWDWFFG
jgi:hypothetical protein